MSDIQHGEPPRIPRARGSRFDDLIDALFAAELGTWVSMSVPDIAKAAVHTGITNAVGHRLIELTVQDEQVFVRCRIPNEWPA